MREFLDGVFLRLWKRGFRQTTVLDEAIRRDANSAGRRDDADAGIAEHIGVGIGQHRRRDFHLVCAQ